MNSNSNCYQRDNEIAKQVKNHYHNESGKE